MVVCSAESSADIGFLAVLEINASFNQTWQDVESNDNITDSKRVQGETPLFAQELS